MFEWNRSNDGLNLRTYFTNGFSTTILVQNPKYANFDLGGRLQRLD